MERRTFLESCAAVSGAAALASFSGAWGAVPPRLYARARLLDGNGEPLKAAKLARRTNYVFHYPYAGTPCFLLRLGQPVTAPVTLQREDGAAYAWNGGVGPGRSVVAFSAICAHKLAYPTREVSFIRYQAEKSAQSAADVIHCCAEHSVYDPARGARVLSGPAPQPLAAILLEYDASTDGLWALGTVGAEQFDAFFGKYDFKLALEHGQGKARRPVGDATVVRELDRYCRQTIQC
jgi:arsenite oxidase small subunit